MSYSNLGIIEHYTHLKEVVVDYHQLKATIILGSLLAITIVVNLILILISLILKPALLLEAIIIHNNYNMISNLILHNHNSCYYIHNKHLIIVSQDIIIAIVQHLYLQAIIIEELVN